MPRPANLASDPWSDAELADLNLPWHEFSAKHNRTKDSWRHKRRRQQAQDPTVRSNKRLGSFSWREANKVIREMRSLGEKASYSQDRAHIRLEVDHPVGVVALADTHIGDWATDPDLLERFTDELLATPDLYVILLGDLAQMAIKLRSVSEVASNLLPPELQLEYIEDWIEDIAPRVLAATWDNHAVEREEKQSGISSFKRLLNRRFVYFNGIGHLDIELGDERYAFALSHRFRGKSQLNPNHAPVRYLREEGHDREIAIMGDYHVPGIQKLTLGGREKVVMNTGSFQINSSYAKRGFSLTTFPVMPMVTLNPHHHLVTPFWSVREWLATRGLL